MPVYNYNFLNKEFFDCVAVIMGEHKNEAKLQKSAMEFEFSDQKCFLADFLCGIPEIQAI
jgi:hypothetical protein